MPFRSPSRGAEIGPHDEDGTTFEKVLRKYGLRDPGLEMMARIVASGVEASLKQADPDGLSVPMPEGAGVMAVSRGMMLLVPDDAENLERALLIYDALYLYCLAQLEFQKDPSLARKPLVERTDALRARLAPARARLTA